MNKHTRWLIWNLLVWGSFAYLESDAIRGRKPTLSVALRHWLGISTSRRDRHVWVVLLTGVLGWFLGHICFGVGPYVNDNRLSLRRTGANS